MEIWYSKVVTMSKKLSFFNDLISLVTGKSVEIKDQDYIENMLEKHDLSEFIIIHDKAMTPDSVLNITCAKQDFLRKIVDIITVEIPKPKLKLVKELLTDIHELERQLLRKRKQQFEDYNKLMRQVARAREYRGWQDFKTS